jgi:hypothetical protein
LLISFICVCSQVGLTILRSRKTETKALVWNYRIVMDRDKVAVVNLAPAGERVRFAHSQPLLTEAQGGAVEAVNG